MRNATATTIDTVPAFDENGLDYEIPQGIQVEIRIDETNHEILVADPETGIETILDADFALEVLEIL